MRKAIDIAAELKRVGLTSEQAAQLWDALWLVAARELSVGDEVEIPRLGRFWVERVVADPEEGGKSSLIDAEVFFEPEPELEELIITAQKEHPDLFKDTPEDEDMQEEEETVSHLSELVSEEKPLGKASQIIFMDLEKVKVDREVLHLVPQDLAKKYSAVPVELKEGTLTVAMINPDDYDTLQVLRKETGLTVNPVLTTKDGLQGILDQYTGLQAEVQEVIQSSDLGISKEDLQSAKLENVIAEEDNEAAPTARIVSSLLKRAVKEKASDIHIEPYEHKVMVRFRLDGILTPKAELPKEIQNAIVARLKILSNLKIDEQRLPQDGRFSLNLDQREVDFRLSTIPVVFGEKVVMRILDKQQGIRQLEEVGLRGRGLAALQKNIQRSHGMILVTGPTGSGKTTSLYAVLGKLMKPDVNIITLEDPVEYRVESINQSQVHNEIGYSFASGLRAIVRQDPDIVMLGEVRDKETAEMAVHAALTGHIVLSTLHTNDSAGAFPRLIDMGIEPFLLTSSIHTVIAQRLTRILDPEKRVKRELTSEERKEIEDELDRMPKGVKEELAHDGVDLDKLTLYEPDPAIGAAAYQGRMGIFEVLDVNESIRQLVLKRSSGDIIKETAIKENGMLTMVQDGLIKALLGLTSLSEVWRVTRE